MGRFRLEEILVVVAAICLTGAVLAPQFSNAGVAMREEQAGNERRTIQAAIDLYRARNAQHESSMTAAHDRAESEQPEGQ